MTKDRYDLSRTLTAVANNIVVQENREIRPTVTLLNTPLVTGSSQVGILTRFYNPHDYFWELERHSSTEQQNPYISHRDDPKTPHHIISQTLDSLDFMKAMT